MELIRVGVPDDKTFWPKIVLDFYKVRHNLSEKDGVVCYKKRIIVPKMLRAEILDILHSAHQGCSSMEARASESLWWPGMKEKIA